MQPKHVAQRIRRSSTTSKLSISQFAPFLGSQFFFVPLDRFALTYQRDIQPQTGSLGQQERPKLSEMTSKRMSAWADVPLEIEGCSARTGVRMALPLVAWGQEQWISQIERT
jgi:hypothetical protein